MESESTGLVTDGSNQRAGGGVQPDWGRFGLSTDTQSHVTSDHQDDEVFEHHQDTEHNELFREDQVV